MRSRQKNKPISIMPIKRKLTTYWTGSEHYVNSSRGEATASACLGRERSHFPGLFTYGNLTESWQKGKAGDHRFVFPIRLKDITNQREWLMIWVNYLFDFLNINKKQCESSVSSEQGRTEKPQSKIRNLDNSFLQQLLNSIPYNLSLGVWKVVSSDRGSVHIRVNHKVMAGTVG